MSDKYDVVIIGAGMGGLVCGCYLAKAGLKVLIVEQHNKPGGYCTSFERQGYRFDVGVHYLGGIKNGSLNKILKELDIKNEIKFNQFDPTDKIIMPNNIVYIRKNINSTIREFQKAFAEEKNNINNFFNFVLKQDFLTLYSKTKKMNFREVLNNFFKSEKLKSTLEVLLGNIGVSAEKASAVSSSLLFREFISDPGWYPEGGIQMFPDTLVRIIESYQGDIILSKKVTKIVIENNKAIGVVLENGNIIRAKSIVSNVDVSYTFTRLINLNTKEKKLLNSLPISPAIFSVYLGLKNDFKNIIKEPATIWSFLKYKVGNYYDNSRRISSVKGSPKYLIITFPFMHDNGYSDKPTIELFIGAPFVSIEFWDEYRDRLMEKLIIEAEKIIPCLRENIKIKFNATPQTFYNYTSNREGAAYGWTSIPKLVTRPVFMSRASVKNLYLAGHWCNGGLSQGGIPQVCVMGRTAARSVMENIGLKWKYKHSVLL